ncbi:MAG TPA: SPOR domain-containing protein, partial [Thermoanaerobaculia bacterium]|nr:SPOR domain-containing protein [Thermoanaerobaculia bacterium]
PVAAFATPDWTGRAPVFVLHFSSHQDRAAAASEAARLGAVFGRPARAVVVDLGAKGVWYRVVVGEFRTADEARAFRADLAAKKTPGMGFVYEMKGSR